jgi:hypothetical protein
MFKTKLHVSGTEGTHNYVVIAASPLGIIAVRLLNSDCYRVRVEPDSPEGANTIAKGLSRSNGWKQPGDSGQNRFSIVVSASNLHDTIAKAVDALSTGNNSDDWKSGDNDWSAALAAVAMAGSTDREVLLERLRQTKTPGVNSASNWTTTTLLAKLVAIDYEAANRGEAVALLTKVKASGLPGANLASQWSIETLRKKALLA